MTTSITFIRDHLAATTTTLMYTQTQKNGVLDNWDKPDPTLVNLQHQPTFQGRLKLGDLDPFHFRVLLALSLGLVSDLTVDQRLDNANLTMRSLDWALMGLINCLETRSQSEISTLMVNRVTPQNVLVDVAMSMEPIKMPKPRVKSASKIRVIVDKTTPSV